VPHPPASTRPNRRIGIARTSTGTAGIRISETRTIIIHIHIRTSTA
jgi:hypothetical protein